MTDFNMQICADKTGDFKKLATKTTTSPQETEENIFNGETQQTVGGGARRA